MSEDRSTEILKNAILLEKRGHAFYAKVAQQAESEAVKKFFQLMAEEEVKHSRRSCRRGRARRHHRDRDRRAPSRKGRKRRCSRL